MRKMQCAVVALTTCLLVPGALWAAEDARRILEQVRDKQVERWAGVDSYYVDQSIMGNRTLMLFERAATVGPDGEELVYFRPVSPVELQERAAQGQGFHNLSADELEQMAQAYRRAGKTLSDETNREMRNAGMPPEVLQSSPSTPWLSMDPETMLGAQADMLDSVAEAKREQDTSQAEAYSSMDAMMQSAELLGEESVDGRAAWHIRMPVEAAQQADSEEVRMHTMELWIDKAEYVPLKMVLTGEMTQDGETRPITMERIASDFRKVPGSRMYEPYKAVMRIQGTLTPEQQAQVADAEKQLAELDQQLADMPENQRNMILQRMGPQMDMLRSLASGGGLEITTVVHEIRVNPSELPDMAAFQSESGTGMAALLRDSAAAVEDARALRKARIACLEGRMKDEEGEQGRRAFGRFVGAVTRSATGFGGGKRPDTGEVVDRVYAPDATARDRSRAAKSLGVSEADIEACRSPQPN